MCGPGIGAALLKPLKVTVPEQVHSRVCAPEPQEVSESKWTVTTDSCKGHRFGL